MRGSVHAAGQAAENDQAAARKIASQPLGHPQSVRRGMASAHDRDPGLGDRIHISAYIKDQRRIVDLLQLRGIGGIVQTDDGNTGGRHASHFIMGQLHGLAGAERLRRNGLNAGRFEFSQRRLENVLHAAEIFDQPPRPGRAEARGEGKGQPVQGKTFAGSGTHGQGFGHFTTSTSSDSRTLTPAKNDVKVSSTHYLC